jgi:transposase
MTGQKKGKNYGEQEEKQGKKENLVARRRKKEKDLIAQIIFKGSLNAVEFEKWLHQHLLPSLKISSLLIMDNSPIHKKNVIRELVEAGGR